MIRREAYRWRPGRPLATPPNRIAAPTRCEYCGKPGDAFSDKTGAFLCADCLFDEADPDAAARIHVEQGSSKR